MPEGQLQPLLAGIDDSSSCKAAADEPKGELGISSVFLTPCCTQSVRGMTVYTQMVSLDCYVATLCHSGTEVCFTIHADHSHHHKAASCKAVA
jgi:hypothetical protein